MNFLELKKRIIRSTVYFREPTANTAYTYLGISWECVQNIKNGKTNNTNIYITLKICKAPS